MRSSMDQMTSKRHPLLQKVLNRTGTCSVIVYLAALAYSAQIIGFQLPVDLGIRPEHTRISEHSFMPGLVDERFDKHGLLSEYLKTFSSKSDRHEKICKIFNSLNIPCFKQDWSVSIMSMNKTGQNVYGVIRTRRGTGVEAMLLAVEIDTGPESLALLMAYAAFAKEQVYWARDIFVLFVDGGAVGMDAFLSRYHLVPHSTIRSDPLPAPGGSLISGIVLKNTKPKSVPGSYKESLKVQLNQLNGQQPNLDLFNSVVKIAGKHGIYLETVIYDVYDYQRDWPLLMPLRAVYTQAFTSIEGPHSVFGKYGLQGLTIVLTPTASSNYLGQSMRLLEGISRSLNNVLERLHQSYFMYILVTEDLFLSIAYYMPCMAVAAPLLFFAYREWVNLISFSVPIPLLLFHLYGGAIWLLTRSYLVDHSATEMERICLLAVFLTPLGLFLPRFGDSWLPSFRFLIYLEFALASLTIALLNFGLAFICTALTVPLFLRVTSRLTTDRRQVVMKAIASIVLHPLVMYLLFLIQLEPFLEYKPRRIAFTIEGITQLVSSSLLRLLRDEMLYGSWLYSLLCLIAIPLWNCFFFIATTTSQPAVEYSEDGEWKIAGGEEGDHRKTVDGKKKTE